MRLGSAGPKGPALRLLFVILIAWSSLVEGQAPFDSAQGRPTAVTVFEGARLITGDGSPPIENSTFIVENTRFTRIGRRGEAPIPAGAVRVDLTGKTVMPAMVDLHGHIGFQDVPAGTMSKESFTRANLIDHLERLAYHGVSGVMGVGDLISRSDLRGGRTNWGDVPLRVRDEIIPNAALFRTAGPGLAWPGSGAQGHPSRMDVSYPVATVEEARAAVQDYVLTKPAFVKIWVTPSLITAWMDTQGGSRPAWLDDPLLRATYSPKHIEEHWGDPLKKMTAEEVARVRKGFELDSRNAMMLRAAGVRIVNGTDTGQSRFWIGYFNHLNLESLVAMGLTPSQAIVAATRDSAAIAGFNTGLVASGRNGDFIVLDANPLDRISNSRRINRVYLRGQEVPRAAMAARWTGSRRP